LSYSEENGQAAISEEWLKSVGFKWHQFDRQPTKQWLLWCGIPNQQDNWGVDSQDIGVEVSEGRDGSWFVWLRSDTAHRYSRFLHLLEMLCGRSFFEPTFIPERFCTGWDTVSQKSFPWADDVFQYCAFDASRYQELGFPCREYQLSILWEAWCLRSHFQTASAWLESCSPSCSSFSTRRAN
jgi:hypothetical protein